MKTKSKVIISFLVLAFVSLALVGIVGVVYAALQQTVQTSLDIDYIAEDIDGFVTATITKGGVTEDLVAIKDNQELPDNKLIFDAGDTQSTGKFQFPKNALALAKDDEVVIKYTYTNTGDKHFIATMGGSIFDEKTGEMIDPNISATNMTIQYGIENSTGEIEYSSDRYSLVIPSDNELSYYIKFNITNRAFKASFKGKFNWFLKGCDDSDLGYKSITSLKFNGNSATISKPADGEQIGEQIVFPSEINNVKITKITKSELSIEDKQGITGVVIPEGITMVEANAFKDFTSLKSVEIPNSITMLGTYTFQNCKELTSVKLGSGVTTIGNSVFKNCIALETIEIPDNVKTIQTRAFENCSSLKHIEIGKDVNSIGSESFYNCLSLESIEVATGNTKYRSEGNCLIDTSTKTLVLGCKNSVIPNNESVTKIGPSSFYGCVGLVGITNSTDEQDEYILQIPSNVTSIGQKAFYGCIGLERVTIPNTVTSIGSYIFQDCTSLTDVTISQSVKTIPTSAFQGCENLKSVTVPGGSASVGAYAFYGCSSLGADTGVLGFTITGVGESAFNGCTNLKSVTLSNNITSIGAYAFYASGLTSIETAPFNLPTKLQTIGGRAFSECVNLKVLTIPSSVTSIGSYAFFGTPIETVNINSLKDWVEIEFADEYANPSYGYYKTLFINGKAITEELAITDDISVIQQYAFYGYASLKEITIPSGVVVKQYAFANCSGIKTLTIDSTAGEIEPHAFANCYSLEEISVTNNNEGNENYRSDSNCLIDAENALVLGCKNSKIPDSVTSIGNYAFEGCTYLVKIDILDTITSIGEGAFSGCTGLSSVDIPSGVTEIGIGAFASCVTIRTITGGSEDGNYQVIYNSVIKDNTLVLACNSTTTIPSGVTTIGNSAFKGLAISSIEIPEGVTSIGDYAFQDCEYLTSITIPSSVTSIGIGAFSGCTSLTKVVIKGEITNISDYAFAYCSKLKTVQIPESVTMIGNYAFYLCVSLGKIKHPGSGQDAIMDISGVQTIGNYAFFDSISNIVIPESVIKIGAYAFARRNYTSLPEVVFVNIEGWFVASSSTATSGTTIDAVMVDNWAECLTQTYKDKFWINK